MVNIIQFKYNYKASMENSCSLSGIMLKVGEAVNGVREDSVVPAAFEIFTIGYKHM